MQALINQSAKIISEVEQTRMCIEKWSRKHVSQLIEIDQKIRGLLVQLQAKAKIIVQQEVMQKSFAQEHDSNIENCSGMLIGDSKFVISQKSALEIAMQLKRGAIEIFK